MFPSVPLLKLAKKCVAPLYIELWSYRSDSSWENMREGAKVQGNEHAEIIIDAYWWNYNFQLFF